jgi:hypothetical protein
LCIRGGPWDCQQAKGEQQCQRAAQRYHQYDYTHK